MNQSPDLLILGGGLAGLLTAYRVHQKNPHLNLLILERSVELSPRTWSFHTSDVASADFEWMRPLLSKSWDRYSVKFPTLKRTLLGGYHSIRSEEFEEKLGLSAFTRKNVEVLEAYATHVVLASGEKIEARAVLDARGFGPTQARLGYQKFVGLDLQLAQPHGLPHAIVMDAVCAQKDGFRFFYLLPWNETTLLIEDTRYSDSPDIDKSDFEKDILDYCEDQGWRVDRILRREVGSLPIPLDEMTQSIKPEGPILLGVRAGLFHPVTGYSLPYAVRLAEKLADFTVKNPHWDVQTVRKQMNTMGMKEQRGGHYFRFLNRMLFLGAAPSERINVMSRFYSLSLQLIQRFYAGHLSFADQVRLLVGKPPIPVSRAIRCIFDTKGGPLGISEGSSSSSR